MKKLTTFIMALLISTFLAGCNCPECKAVREEVSALRTELETHAEVQLAKDAELTNTLTEISAQISEFGTSLAEKPVAKEESTPKTETIVSSGTQLSKELQVTAVYNKRYFVIPTQTDANKKLCVENPFVLPYKDEDGKVRDLSLLVSGPAVKSVFRVDEKFQEVEGLSFNRVGDVTHIYFYMENNGYGGDYFFKIVTESNTVVYLGVYYGIDR